MKELTKAHCQVLLPITHDYMTGKLATWKDYLRVATKALKDVSVRPD